MPRIYRVVAAVEVQSSVDLSDERFGTFVSTLADPVLRDSHCERSHVDLHPTVDPSMAGPRIPRWFFTAGDVRAFIEGLRPHAAPEWSTSRMPHWWSAGASHGTYECKHCHLIDLGRTLPDAVVNAECPARLREALDAFDKAKGPVVATSNVNMSRGRAENPVDRMMKLPTETQPPPAKPPPPRLGPPPRRK